MTKKTTQIQGISQFYFYYLAVYVWHAKITGYSKYIVHSNENHPPLITFDGYIFRKNTKTPQIACMGDVFMNIHNRYNFYPHSPHFPKQIFQMEPDIFFNI